MKTSASLPACVGALHKLEVLDLSENRVSSLQPLAPLSSLLTLNANGNEISDISPLNFEALARLETLSLARNRLTALPDEIGLLQQLAVLNVAENEIAELKNTITKSPTILSGALTGLKIKIARSTSAISGSTTPKLKPNLDAKSASDQAPHEGNDLAVKSPMRTMMESVLDQGKTLINKIRKNSSRKGSMDSN